MGPTLTYMLLLVLAAMVFFFLEILTPSFGLLGALALAALVAAIVLGFTISEALGIGMIVASLVLVPLYWTLVIKLLPKSPLGKRLFLGRSRKGDADAVPEAEALEALVGKAGQAETTLRPTGAVRIEGRRYIASAESGMIPAGATVKVARSGGMDLVVREVRENS